MSGHNNFCTNLQFGLPEWISTILDPNLSYRTDEEKMRLVIELSRQNVQRKTGGPFGAAVFRSSDDTLISVGVNSVELLRNSVLHAEVFALMLAERILGSHSLRSECQTHFILATSCSPCAMCLGAILWSGVKKVICGATRQDAIQIGFDEGPVFPESIPYLEARGVEFVNGVLAADAKDVLTFYLKNNGLIYNG